MVVSVHLLSLCTLFSRASLGTLHDAPGYEDRSSDLPVRAHTPATLRHLLRVRPSSSVSKNFPAADRRFRWWSKAVNFISLFSLAAFRTPASPWDTPFPLCVEYVLG